MAHRIAELKILEESFTQFDEIELDNISIRNLSGSFTIIPYQNNFAQLIVHNVFKNNEFKQTLLEQFDIVAKKYKIIFIKLCVAKDVLKNIPKDKYEEVVIDSNGGNIISFKVENLKHVIDGSNLANTS